MGCEQQQRWAGLVAGESFPGRDVMSGALVVLLRCVASTKSMFQTIHSIDVFDRTH